MNRAAEVAWLEMIHCGVDAETRHRVTEAIKRLQRKPVPALTHAARLVVQYRKQVEETGGKFYTLDEIMKRRKDD